MNKTYNFGFGVSVAISPGKDEHTPKTVVIRNTEANE